MKGVERNVGEVLLAKEKTSAPVALWRMVGSEWDDSSMLLFGFS
jgi:hypothetical protein